ncbi:MAG TPA: polyprenol monophosphomannose synthase [Thermomicrobiales bacterium]|nr:polyprenol monophosphomannose synthase [Thermomicrobiales bacterium]
MPTANPGRDASTAVTVVIPTYNERDNLASLVTELMALDAPLRVLVVDDASPDGTGELADELACTHSGRVHVLHRTAKEGLGRAYIAGFQRALALDTPYIAQMDADHSHQPADLARMIAVATTSGADLVLGSRYIAGGSTRGWPWHRRLISRAGGVYAGLILGVPIRDLTGGFKIWTRETLQAIELESIHSDGYSFQIETTYRALRKRHTHAQVPITFHDRVAGRSKLSRRVVIEAALVVWQLRLRQLLGRSW